MPFKGDYHQYFSLTSHYGDERFSITHLIFNNAFLKRCNRQANACIRNWFPVLDFQYKGSHFKRKKNCFGKKSCFLPKIAHFWIFQKVCHRLQMHQF